MRQHLSFVVLLILLAPVILPAQIENPVVFQQEDTDSLMQAEFLFSSLPRYNQECSLTVKLIAISEKLNVHAYISSKANKKNIHSRSKNRLFPGKELDLNLKVGPERYALAPDTIISWAPPISPGDSVRMTIPIIFRGVGEFVIQLLEIENDQNIIRMLVSVVIDEKGNLVYLGKYPSPVDYPLKAHLFVFGDKIQTRIEGSSSFSRHYRKSWPEPFDIEMTISPGPKVGKASWVNLAILPMMPEIIDLQYEIIGATNLNIDSLSPSPGAMTDSAGRINLAFQIMPKQTGRSYISFEIFGFIPDAKYSEMPFSRMDYHLIFGSDSSLLYMGEIDPFAVGFEEGNPAYQKIDEIIDFSETMYGKKVYRSEPDFEYDRIDHQRALDSLEASKQLDTLDIDN